VDLVNLEQYAPLLASLALGSLGVVALASGRREAVWRLFATFCLLLMGATGLAFVVPVVESDQLTLIGTRIAPTLAFLSFLFAMLYVAEYSELFFSMRLFGSEITFDFARGKRRIVLFGRTLPFRAYLSAIVVFWAVLIGTISGSGLLIRSVHLTAGGQIAAEPGPLIYLGLLVVLSGLLKIDYFLVSAYRSSTLRARREYLLLNFVAFNVAYMPALTSALVLPLLGHPLRPALFLGFPVAVLLFYVAILRNQFSQVARLTRGLEHKVEERTAALRQAQVRLVRSEKMASLGQLVAGVAHELNNPVGAIRGLQQSADIAVARLATEVESLRADAAAQVRLSKLLRVLRDANRVIDEGSARVAEVVARLRSFARLDESEWQDADIHDGIRDVLALLEHELGREVEVITEFGKLPSIRCHPSALNQVWMNVLVNAKDALAGKRGRIRIRTECDEDDVRVQIEDTGCGVPTQDLPRVFDPGFTTKGVGVGTGLGLAICYQIVAEHGGRIEMSSRPAAGTTVSVSLDRNLQKGAATPAASQSAS
jgi:signal transduction histidine kinase